MELIPSSEKDKWKTEVGAIATKISSMNTATKAEGLLESSINNFYLNKALEFTSNELIQLDCEKEHAEKQVIHLTEIINSNNTIDKDALISLKDITTIIPSSSEEKEERIKEIFNRRIQKEKMLQN